MKQNDFSFRNGTVDAEVFNAVFTCNEYHLPENINGWTVVDLGLHIGSFSYLSHIRGAKKIIGVEADADNYAMCEENLKELPNVIIYNRAIWHVDDLMLNVYAHAPINTGGGGVYDGNSEELRGEKDPARTYVMNQYLENNMEGEQTHMRNLDDYSPHTTKPNKVKSVTLKTLMDENGISDIDFLKVDIELAEFNVFNSMDDDVLKSIKRISGEWHSQKSLKILKHRLDPFFDTKYQNVDYALGSFSAVKKDIKRLI